MTLIIFNRLMVGNVHLIASVGEVLGLVLLALIFSVFAFIWNSIHDKAKSAASGLAGSDVPLPPRDEGLDDVHRGISNCEKAPRKLEDFPNIKSIMCPLHSEEYVGWTGFEVIQPAQYLKLGFSPPQDKALYWIYLIGCQSCFFEARKLRDFKWKRSNADQHPIWASCQIYPHLLKDRRIQISRPMYLFDTPKAKEALQQLCMSIDQRTKLDVIDALGEPTEFNISILKRFLSDPDELVSAQASIRRSYWRIGGAKF